MFVFPTKTCSLLAHECLSFSHAHIGVRQSYRFGRPSFLHFTAHLIVHGCREIADLRSCSYHDEATGGAPGDLDRGLTKIQIIASLVGLIVEPEKFRFLLPGESHSGVFKVLHASTTVGVAKTPILVTCIVLATADFLRRWSHRLLSALAYGVMGAVVALSD